MVYLLLARPPDQATVSTGVWELKFGISEVFAGPSAMVAVVDTSLRF